MLSRCSQLNVERTIVTEKASLNNYQPTHIIQHRGTPASGAVSLNYPGISTILFVACPQLLSLHAVSTHLKLTDQAYLVSQYEGYISF
jgi:hypothetical protein